MYRESTGVPMIVAGPGIPAGKVSETPVSLVDIQNTLLECTGCDAALIDGSGKSLVELARPPRRLCRLNSTYGVSDIQTKKR